MKNITPKVQIIALYFCACTIKQYYYYYGPRKSKYTKILCFFILVLTNFYKLYVLPKYFYHGILKILLSLSLYL